MKTIGIFLGMTVAMVITAFSNQLHDETATFKVSGNCEMCKKRIESSLKKPGIKSANWNVDTKMITVVYDTHSMGLEDIHKSIAAAGYDTEKQKASDKAYNKLPECCQYDRAK